MKSSGNTIETIKYQNALTDLDQNALTIGASPSELIEFHSIQSSRKSRRSLAGLLPLRN